MKRTSIKELIEDYKRRLDSVGEMLRKDKNSGSINDEKKFERLTTKASEYRNIITDLERAVSPDEDLVSALVEAKQCLKLMSEGKSVRGLDEVYANIERIVGEFVNG